MTELDIGAFLYVYSLSGRSVLLDALGVFFATYLAYAWILALIFFSIATVLFCFNRKIGALAFAAAAFMGIARVYAGVHWPSDILAGASLGTLAGLAAYRLYTRHKDAINAKPLTISRVFAIN